jgi:hypothetical protein
VSAAPKIASAGWNFSIGREDEAVAFWCLTDVAFAIEQFERAWRRIAPERDPVAREHVQALRSMWERRQAPR